MNSTVERMKMLVGMEVDEEEVSAQQSDSFIDDFNRNCTLSTTQRFYGFAICLASGLACTLLSMLVFFNPIKFGIAFTLGNLLALGRARTRAAKVGKGLSKDEKARKLALQHWLEAIDPRHRYGHNLQFYYAKWLHCESGQPFFYWLDIGDGKEVNLERCPRPKLHQQCIKYLGPAEREIYEVAVENGTFIYKKSGKVLDTTEGPQDAKWIFVLSTSKTLYVGMKNKSTFQHSSFLAGGATLSAGRLIVEDGILKVLGPCLDWEWKYREKGIGNGSTGNYHIGKGFAGF